MKTSILEQIIKESEITNEGSEYNLNYESDFYKLEAYSNFANGKSSLDFWIEDELTILNDNHQFLVFDAIEKQMENNEINARYNDDYPSYDDGTNLILN